VVNLSDFPEGSFGKTNGLEITDHGWIAFRVVMLLTKMELLHIQSKLLKLQMNPITKLL
jgi:peroxiredoxin